MYIIWIKDVYIWCINSSLCLTFHNSKLTDLVWVKAGFKYLKSVLLIRAPLTGVERSLVLFLKSNRDEIGRQGH